jgi:hypothetical protein
MRSSILHDRGFKSRSHNLLEIRKLQAFSSNDPCPMPLKLKKEKIIKK